MAIEYQRRRMSVPENCLIAEAGVIAPDERVERPRRRRVDDILAPA